MDTENGYGIHRTIYAGLLEENLYAMYRQDTWGKLGESERQQLLQETVNRSAMEHGELGSCEVVFSRSLGRGVDGQQSGNVIYMDYEKFVNDRQISSYNGEMIVHKVEDSNMQALLTALHEDEHAWQNQVIDGCALKDAQGLAKEEYLANNFTVSEVELNGTVYPGSQYLNGISDYYLYYFQSTERDAFVQSEKKTAQIMESLTQKYGNEPSFDVYREGMKVNGYETMLHQAQERFQNENIENEINRALLNAHYEELNLPVDPNVENAVKREMILSYQEQYLGMKSSQQSKDSHVQEGKDMGSKMDFSNLCVTKEDYAAARAEQDQMLRNTVNEFYQHALNDPSMSREDAIRETAQMAEKYHEAMEQFDAEMSARMEASGLEAQNINVSDTQNAMQNSNGAQEQTGIQSADVSNALEAAENSGISKGENTGMNTDVADALAEAEGSGTSEGAASGMNADISDALAAVSGEMGAGEDGTGVGDDDGGIGVGGDDGGIGDDGGAGGDDGGVGDGDGGVE